MAGLLVKVLLTVAICMGSPTVAGAAECLEPFSRPTYPTRQAFCRPGGHLPDAYDGGRMIRCEEVEVDHLISLRQAWASGVCGDDLKRLARDPRNLRFTHWQTNRRKGYLSPEIFVERLDAQDAENVLSDARALMRDYRIKPAQEATFDRMLAMTTSRARNTRIVTIKGTGRLSSITWKQVNGRSVAYVGRKAVGYAVGAGVVLEAISLSSWAADWLMTPEQDDRMAARAEAFRTIFEVLE